MGELVVFNSYPYIFKAHFSVKVLGLLKSRRTMDIKWFYAT